MQRSEFRIYLASSWRNTEQPRVLAVLRAAGYDVYDFKNPPNGSGFAWSEVGVEPRNHSAVAFREALAHPRAEEAYQSDFDAMRSANACVMLQPCGSSAALELGWCAGAALYTVAYLADNAEPELMVKMSDALVVSDEEILARLDAFYHATTDRFASITDVVSGSQR